MDEASRNCLVEARERLKRFLRHDSSELLFTQPIASPARPTGLCYCDRSLPEIMRVYLRAVILEFALHQPSARLKTAILRLLGVRVGRNVHLAWGVWLDPIYPHLIEIEDDVFVGMWARIFTHEFRRNEFRVGRIRIRRGASSVEAP